MSEAIAFQGHAARLRLQRRLLREHAGATVAMDDGGAGLSPITSPGRSQRLPDRRIEAMFVYSLSPIDDWRGWQKPEDLFRATIDTSPDANPAGKDEPLGAFEPHRWARAWTSARAAARKLQWKGDIRPGGGPYITILPAAEPGGLPLFVIAWKQQDNGTTFVASPVRLPWLEVEGNEWLGCADKPTPR